MTVRTVARSLRRAAWIAQGTAADRWHALRATSNMRTDQAARPTILLDGCAFQEPHTGIARLWRSILAEWSASGFARHVVVADRDGTAPSHPAFRYRRAPRLRAHDISAERVMLEALCAAEAADLFVSTLYSYPARTRSLQVVHDLTPEILGWDPSAPVWRDKRAAIERADAFVSISQNTAIDLHRIYPSSALKPATIALPGVDPVFAPATRQAIDALRRELGLPDTYFMFVGHRDIHKNAELVFEAAARHPQLPTYGLLLVGGRPKLEPGLARLAGDVPVAIARLDDGDLRAAYSGAAALLFPSRYEGFGLVALEAMACGCPVITCRNSAIPEATGDAALFVGEDDPEAMAHAMERMLDTDTRRDLVERGLEWSARFRWSDMAAAIEAAIREAADAG